MIHHEEEVLGKAYDARLMRRMMTYMKPYKGSIILAVTLLLVVSLLQLVGPILTMVAIDQYIAQGNGEGLFKIALLYFGVLLFIFVLRYGQTLLTQYTGQRVMVEIRMALFRHIQRLHLAFFDRTPVGRLMTRLTGDVENLKEVLTSGVVAIFGDVFTLIGIVTVMVFFHPKLALVTFSVIPILFFATLLFKTKVRESYRLIRTRLARMNAYLQENITGMRIVQIFNREEKNFEKFDHLNRLHLDAYLKTIFYYSLFFPGVSLIRSIAIGLILWYGGVRILGDGLTLGILVAFIQFAERFFQPIQDLSEKYNILQTAMASSERIFQLLDTEVKIEDPLKPLPFERIEGHIQFEGVSFAYHDHDYVLKEISFEVQKGERVALVGATGAGKTSIINLLCRFYEPQEGQILIDGKDIRQVRQKDLRRHIGVVLQDVFLFSGTIASNIRLGNGNLNAEDLQRAAKVVNAHRFINRLPRGYEEKVSERGSNLSQGERQLLAFARALAHNPEILLVLDEATASVDTETEYLIQDALAKLMKDRTSIIIAHRLSTIQKVDRILVLHKGRIREEGTHQELLRQGGLYAKLYELQFKNLVHVGD
ncbi:ABC transporter ATP-binding protein [candidate division TA06 bacterium]|nr:ABC transporter ATP-binding protein [candidate division TA06 bacterium]